MILDLFAPYTAEDMWERLGYEPSVALVHVAQGRSVAARRGVGHRHRAGRRQGARPARGVAEDLGRGARGARSGVGRRRARDRRARDRERDRPRPADRQHRHAGLTPPRQRADALTRRTASALTAVGARSPNLAWAPCPRAPNPNRSTRSPPPRAELRRACAWRSGRPWCCSSPRSPSPPCCRSRRAAGERRAPSRRRPAVGRRRAVSATRPTRRPTSASAPILVHVLGAVARPGLVELAQGGTGDRRGRGGGRIHRRGRSGRGEPRTTRGRRRAARGARRRAGRRRRNRVPAGAARRDRRPTARCT